MGLEAHTGHNRTRTFVKYIKRDKYLLMLMLPAAAYFLIFAYIPMGGIAIAFQRFSAGKGFFGSEWVGFKWFMEFFNSFFFSRTIRNTFLLNFYSLIWSFPVPIIFALLLNEAGRPLFKKAVQTVTYLPHFISIVVVAGMMVNFLSPTDGIVNNVIKSLGMQPVNFMADTKWFRTLYISSGIWQEFGWTSILYLAALAGIDPQLYEAVKIDGANRFKQVLHITLPGIMPTIVILLILSIGSMMTVGLDKIILIYNPSTYEVSDVISTYVYRKGIIGMQYSFATAVGLFNSVVNFILLFFANWLSKKVNQTSLW